MIWNLYLYEDEKIYESVVASEDLGFLIRDKADRRGAIVIGTHCILNIYGLAFYKKGIPLRILAGDMSPYSHVTDHCIDVLLSKKIRFILHNIRFFKTRFSEKQLVSYVRDGGIVLMHLDIDTQSRSSITAELLGFTNKFSTFPFKVAIRYNVPLYFSFISENKTGGYRISVIPLRTFSTPEEGIIAYRNFIELRIRENPEMWLYTSEYKKFN